MKTNPTCGPTGNNDEISALVRTLRETERRLRLLTGGGLDAADIQQEESYQLLQEAQGRLRHSEEQFRSIFVAAATGIAVSTPGGDYLHANAAYCQMLGYSEAELLDTNFAALTHPEDLPPNLEVLNDLLAGRRQSLFGEKRYLKKNGEILWVRYSVAPARKQSGEIETLTLVAENITEGKLAEARLHRLNRLQRVLSKVAEAIVRTRTRQELYEIVCRIVVEEGLLRLAFLAEIDAQGTVARPVASFGVGHECLLQETGVIPLDGGALSQGTLGSAIRTGSYDVCNDIASALRMEPWHEPTRNHGLLASASFPIFLRGVTAGVLTLFAGETEYFQDDEIRPMVSVASNLSFALETMEKDQERRRTEDALARSEERLHLITDLVPHGIFAKDSAGRHIFANRALAQLAGMPVEEILGKTDFELVADKAQADSYRIADLAVIRSGKKMIISEEPRTDLSGQTRFLQTMKIPFTIGETGEQAVLGVCMDITERRRTDARFRRLVDSNLQGVILWSTKGPILEANDAFLRIVDYTREDLASGRLNWLALTPPEHKEKDDRAMRQIAATGISEPYEKEFIRRNGSRVSVLIAGTTFEDNPEEGVAFVLDLTDRKKLEQQFLRAQRTESLGTLAGGIAHDLNNILTPILLSIDLLKTLSANPACLEILETIEVSANRGAEIVRQVLAFTRGMDPQKIVIRPEDLLKELERIIKEIFPKNVLLQFSVPSDIWSFSGDPTQMQQVLLNLCVNARDAMPDGGSLTITVENCILDDWYLATNIRAKAGRYVNISVTDSGTGIAQDVIDKIFDPFFTTKELNKGTGLGLSTVMAIIKNHDGIINVYSEPGKGTTFKLYLQATDESSETEWKQTHQINVHRGNGETILLVDDEPSILTIARQALEAFGYRILTAQNGEEAVAIYLERKDEIAVVVTDMMMPVMDGASLIRILLQTNPGVTIVRVSGLSLNGSRETFAETRAKHFLTKPYTAETLLNTIGVALKEA